MPDDTAVVFIDNHDTERGEADLTYRDGDLYLMANALMLADDYGTPVLYSGYAFSDRDAGAPTDADGRVVAETCGGARQQAGGLGRSPIGAEASDLASLSDGDRTCTHASTAIAGMLEWRRVAGAAARQPGADERDAYGFEREGRAVIAANPGSEPQQLAIPTSLPSGSYCDVVLAGPASAKTRRALTARRSRSRTAPRRSPSAPGRPPRSTCSRAPDARRSIRVRIGNPHN